MTTSTATEVLRCLDCGKCTSACPVARYNHSLSPRRLMRRLGADGNGRDRSSDRSSDHSRDQSPVLSPDLSAVWHCLTCMQCDTRCPQEVPISSSIPALRRLSRDNGTRPEATRCSAIDMIANLQSGTDLPQRRLDWLQDTDLRTDPESKVLLWTGCTPYFDAFFAEKGVATLDAVKGTLRLLNALDIAPRISGDERCCGHDQLWGADEATFEQLARRNVKMFEDSAPELVVTVCPECQLTLLNEYQRRFGQPDCPVVHVAELMAERGCELSFDQMEMAVAFEDPCRLGRHQGKYEEPRNALDVVPGLELKEMPHRKSGAVCCSGNWLACNQATKRIQTDLLKEAAATGSKTLVTACPKCLIHLKCAQSGDDPAVPDLEIRDLADVIAGALTQEGA